MTGTRPAPFTKKIRLKFQPQVQNLTSAELAREMQWDAAAYLLAAERIAVEVSPMEQIALRMPINFLLGHACELAIKSMLATKGWDEGRLKRELGHDLERGLRACADEGPVVAPEFREYALFVSDAHRNHWFRYAGKSIPWIGYDDAIRMVATQVRP